MTWPTDDFAFAVESAQLGFAVIDAELIVCERLGPLAQWLPGTGRPCGESGLLFRMEPALEALQAPGATPFELPSVALPELSERRFNVAIVWNPGPRRYIVTVAAAAGTAQLDRLLLQERRENQLWREQAKAAADRLRVSGTLYRDIVESTGDAVLRLTSNLRVAFANAPAATLAGLAADAAVGRPVAELLPLPRSSNSWRLDMCADGPASFEQPVRRPDGGLRWLWWSVHWLGSDEGPAEFQAIGRDVTESRRLRAELERANEQAKTAALAQERLRIAQDLHDTFIHSLVETMSRLALLRRAAAEGPLKDAIAEAEREARAGLRAAREAVGAMRSELEFLEGPVARVIADAEALQAKMEVAVEVERDLPSMSPAHAAAIVRIAREALRNVERHSGARKASVSLRLVNGAVVLRVADDGLGFSTETAQAGHFGLTGMREQALFAGGLLEIETAANEGVRVTLSFPSP